MGRSTKVLGRSAAVRRVRACLDRGSTITLRGPAGIGKTATVDTAVGSRATAAGVGLSSLRTSPWFPLEMALRVDLEGEPETVAARVLEVIDDRVLRIEDLHWVHPSTARALALLVGRVPMVLTTRPTDLPEEHKILIGATEQLDLEALDCATSLRLLRTFRPGIDNETADEVIGVAKGNPLLLQVLSRTDVSIGPTICDALIDTVISEDPTVQQAVKRLAVYGRPAPAHLIGDAAESPLITTSSDGVWFRHPLLAEVVGPMASSDPVTLSAIHADLAELVEAVDAGEHLLAAGKPAEALAHASEWTERSAFAAERARHLLLAVRAADALGTNDDRLRLRTAEALLQAQRWDEAIEIAETVSGVDLARRAQAHFCVGQARWYLGDVTAALEAYEMAAAVVPDDAPRVRTRIQSESAYVRLRHQVPGGFDRAALAMDSANASGEGQVRARALLGVARAFGLTSDWESTMREVLDDARQGSDREVEMTCAYSLTSTLGMTGHMSAANRIHDEQISRAVSAGLPAWKSQFESSRILNLSLMGGRPADVVAQVEALLHNEPRLRTRSQTMMALALAHTDLGAVQTADRIGRDLIATADDPEGRLFGAIALSQAAWLVADSTAMDLALTSARDSGDLYFGMRVMVELDALHVGFELGLPVAEFAVPDLILPLLWPVHDEVAAFELCGAGEPLAAARRFGSAASGWIRHEMPRLAARALWARATLLEAAGASGAGRSRRSAATLARSHSLGGHLAKWGVRRGTRLSAREEEVLRLVARGLPSRRIGDELTLSSSTVDAYVRSAMRKTGARSRREAALLATQSDPQVDDSETSVGADRTMTAVDAVYPLMVRVFGGQRALTEADVQVSDTVGPSTDVAAVLRAAARGVDMVLRLELAEADQLELIDQLVRVAEVQAVGPEGMPLAPVERLGPRLDGDQAALLELVRCGHSIPSAAIELGMSRRTAYRRMNTTVETLSASSPVDAVHRARALGLLAHSTSDRS